MNLTAMALAIIIALSFHRRRFLQIVGAVSLCLISPVYAAVISVSDVSHVGFKTDPNNDGIANQQANNKPTPFSFKSKANIAVAQYAGDVQPIADGWLAVDIHLVVKNIGDVGVNNLDLLSKLAEQLPDGAQFRIKRITSQSQSHPIAPTFNGDTQPKLIAAGSQLAVGKSFDIFYTLEFLPTSVVSPLNLEATALASGPHNQARDQSFDSKLPKDEQDGPTLVAFAPTGCDITGGVFHDQDQNGSFDSGESPSDFPICVALYNSAGDIIDNALVDDGVFVVTADTPGNYEIEIGEVKGSQCHIGSLPDTWRYLSSQVVRVQVGSGQQCLSKAKAAPAFALLEGSEVSVVAYLENGRRGADYFNGIQQLSEQTLANVDVVAYCRGVPCAEDKTHSDGRVSFILPSSMLNDAKDLRFKITGPRNYIALPIRATDPAVDRLNSLDDGVDFSLVSAKTTVFQPFVKANVLVQNQTINGNCRERLLAPHIYTANGPGKVDFSIDQASGSTGWRYHVHQDLNCDGVLQSNESAIVAPIVMDVVPASPEPSQICVLVAAIAPACTSENIAANTRLVAKYTYLNSAVEHEVKVSDRWLAKRAVELDADVKISKTVWNATHDREGSKAAPCEVLEYRVSYVNEGQGPARNLVIRDRVGEWSLLHEEPFCGEGVNCSPKIDSGKIGEFATVSWKINDVIEPGDKGYVVYRTHIDSNKICEYETNGTTPK